MSGTVLFSVSASVAAAVPDVFAVPFAGLALVLFGLGLAAFVAALLLAAQRSRRQELSVAGLFLLSGSAPGNVRTILLGALAIQVVVAFVTAGLRPFTPLAFGILVPTFGLGACGLWAARHGSFPERTVRRRGGGTSPAGTRADDEP